WRAQLAPNLEGICPYKGLRYFDIDDAPYFYGRETLTDQLLDQVKIGKGNFLAVLGPSGSGKSSAVRAGLIHQLQQGRRLSGSEHWKIRILTPGEHPLENLASAFLDDDTTDIDRAEQLRKAEEAIAGEKAGLARLVKVSHLPRLVLLIDQFEEIFTLCQNLTERQQFLTCLLEALEQSEDRLCIILTMRADFLNKCTEQDYGGLADRIQAHLVTVKPMTARELEQVIREPARQVGLRVDDNLVTQIISDLSIEGIPAYSDFSETTPNWEPGSLPLLEYTLGQLWQYRTLDRLTLDSYIHLGGVRRALGNRADKVYQSFSLEEKRVAKRIFIELTQLGEGSEDTRRRVVKQNLTNSQQSEALVDKVIQRLAVERLIVTSKQAAKGVKLGQVVVIDIAHEALIRYWQQLRYWINENRNALKKQREVEEYAMEWQNSKNNKDYLLQGLKLAEAQDFLSRYIGDLPLSILARKFVQKSIQKRRKDRIRLVRHPRQSRWLDE
ncbi:MAG: ATP-binding protein, partial [Cyanothece sp. SIO1E1]|nr:ATP-binding protein [Cyanothece sp. SIO1E1]